jgi:hypothetical protein
LCHQKGKVGVVGQPLSRPGPFTNDPIAWDLPFTTGGRAGPKEYPEPRNVAPVLKLSELLLECIIAPLSMIFRVWYGDLPVDSSNLLILI